MLALFFRHSRLDVLGHLTVQIQNNLFSGIRNTEYSFSITSVVSAEAKNKNGLITIVLATCILVGWYTVFVGSMWENILENLNVLCSWRTTCWCIIIRAVMTMNVYLQQTCISKNCSYLMLSQTFISAHFIIKYFKRNRYTLLRTPNNNNNNNIRTKNKGKTCSRWRIRSHTTARRWIKKMDRKKIM